jgi:hypothetical protein
MTWSWTRTRRWWTRRARPPRRARQERRTTRATGCRGGERDGEAWGLRRADEEDAKKSAAVIALERAMRVARAACSRSASICSKQSRSCAPSRTKTKPRPEVQQRKPQVRLNARGFSLWRSRQCPETGPRRAEGRAAKALCVVRRSRRAPENVERAAQPLDQESRTLSLSFSSETPVARWFGNERSCRMRPTPPTSRA